MRLSKPLIYKAFRYIVKTWVRNQEQAETMVIAHALQRDIRIASLIDRRGKFLLYRIFLFSQNFNLILQEVSCFFRWWDEL